MRLYAVALITWAAFITVSSEHNTADLNDEKTVDYTDLPVKQIVQPYVTEVEARSSGQIGTEDRSDDFANAGLSRSAVHASSEERGSNGVSTTDSSSIPGSIYATPLSEIGIRLESTDKYPFGDYPSHEPEDVLLVENAGNFGEKVQDRPGDGTIVRTVLRTGEDQRDNVYASLPKAHSSTVSPFANEDNRKRPYTSATREPFVLALKEDSNLADDSSPDDTKAIESEISAGNPGKTVIEVTTENITTWLPSHVAAILENDVVPEILPTPQARLSRARNSTANEETAERSAELGTKKSENLVKTSTTVEIVPSFQARFSGPIIVADLPDRETQEMLLDYMDDASDAYRPIENGEITSETNVESLKTAPSASITSSAMLNPLQVGITLVNANQAGLTYDDEQSVAMNLEDYPQDDLQRLATDADRGFIKNDRNQSRIDYQDDSFERDDVEKRVEVDIQKIPDNSVEIQKSIEIYHTAPVHEIHYPPEYIQQTANLGVIETNSIGNLQKSKQPYDQVEESELRPTYDIYRGNDQDERDVVKAHASTFSQKLNRHEYNALEDDVGRPLAPAVGAEYPINTHVQASLELQPFKYVQPVLLAPNQFDDTLYEQTNVQHNFNGNDNNNGIRAKPIGTGTRQETASEPVKPYNVPNAYRSVQQQSQSNQPYNDHQHSFRSPEIRRPEVPQLLLRIIPEGSAANGGFVVPISRPYSHERTVHAPPRPIETEKKVPAAERPVENKAPIPVPQPYTAHVQAPVEKPIVRLPHIYPLHIERLIEKRVPYTVQRLVVQPPLYPLHVRLPAAHPAYTAAPIEQQQLQPAHTTVPIEKAAGKPAAAAASSRPPARPYRANAESGGGPIETRFKYYQKPQEAIFAGENANSYGGIAGGLTFVPPQLPQAETNASHFYGIPYGKPTAYDYNVDVSKNYVPTAHFSNVKLVILPKKFGSHVIMRPHAATPSYNTVPSFGRQVLYNLVEKDKAVKDEYVGPAPPRKTSPSKVYPQTKSPQFSTSAQALAVLRKSRQPEAQHRGSFRQSKMEYGFKPPMVPSIQYDENTASKVEN